MRFTLQKMARGGLYDQLGGGFCRYSVDERWEIPHFEKMLYDNAQLLPLYADAWLATGEAANGPSLAAALASIPSAMTCSGAWRWKPARGSCAICNRPTAAITPRSMPIPKATKASSMPGMWTK